MSIVARCISRNFATLAPDFLWTALTNCRGYLQNWLYQGLGFDLNAIPEKSAQKIFRAADQILKAGRLTIDEEEPVQ